MDTRAVRLAIQSALMSIADMDAADRREAGIEDDAALLEGAEVLSFQDAQILTQDAGLIIRLAHGLEVQLTIVRSN